MEDHNWLIDELGHLAEMDDHELWKQSRLIEIDEELHELFPQRKIEHGELDILFRNLKPYRMELNEYISLCTYLLSKKQFHCKRTDIAKLIRSTRKDARDMKRNIRVSRRTPLSNRITDLIIERLRIMYEA
jgi:hypothetical protein